MRFPFLVLRSFLVFISSIIIPVPGSVNGLSPENDNQDTVKTQVRQPVYTTSRLVTPRPVIDGKLDDKCWKNGIWAGDYHQFIPNEGAKPTYPTKSNIQYDDKYLYIAFRAFDGEPDKIVRMSGVRDETVGDMVGLTLDSYRDYRTGFEFIITAWGQKVDLVLFNPMNWDFNWNAVWKGCRVQGAGCRVQGAGCREPGTRNKESELIRNLKPKSFSHVSAIVNPLFSIVSKNILRILV